jgi:hypothetical protein
MHAQYSTTLRAKMRTGVLLSLAALAVGPSTSFAPVVDYVNVSLQANKLHFLSLPVAPVDGNYAISNTIVLDTGDGRQDFANLYTWAGTKWNDNVPMWFRGTWDDPSLVISNGVGFFLASAANSTLTFVGAVREGVLKYYIPAGLSTLANMVPFTENFPGSTNGNTGDIVFTWNQARQAWENVVWEFLGPEVGGSGWDNGGSPGNNTNGPALNPAEAVFYINGGAPISFTRSFTVF